MKRLILAIACLLAACAPVASPTSLRPAQTPSELAEFEHFKPVVDRVADRIARSNGDLCKSHCYLGVGINVGNGIGAFSDTQRAYVTFDLLRFVKSDDELAVIIAHEWAHMLMGDTTHSNPDPRAIELRADCIGSLLAKRAGYSIPKASEAYARMGNSVDGAMLKLTSWSFPAWGDRQAVLSRVEQQSQGRVIDRDLIKQVCGAAL